MTGHPAAFFSPEIIHTLRTFAAEAEKSRQLRPEQLHIIYQHNWFRMFVPKALGGLGAPLPDALKIEEALAWTDGSTAWVVTLCSGAGWFAGFISPEIAVEIFSNDDVCLAGSGALTGTASVVPGGYEINGSWKYASGSVHATVFTANCHIQKEGRPLYEKDGSPVVRAFLFNKEEVTVYRTWNAMGMLATGSHSFSVHHLKVSENRSFRIDATHAVLGDVVYQFPFLQLAETTLAVNISGMAVRFIELCESGLQEREQRQARVPPVWRKEIKASCGALNKARQFFYSCVNSSWEVLKKNGEIPSELLKNVSASSHDLVKVSRKVLNALYPLCGLSAADASTEINRVWRNFFTASQHALFNMRE